MMTEEYQKRVIDDLKNYVGLNYPRRASIIERLLVRHVRITKLHPNPTDEFSMPAIGPNYEIIGKYEKELKRAIEKGTTPITEPLIAEKMSTGGYMLLNGHHRWMAAYRLGLRSLPVQIVNVTPEDEIFTLVNRSSKDKCVSFDLDEILLTDGEKYPPQKKLVFPFNKIYKNITLRKNAKYLIDELRKLSFDVWVYTGNYYSTEYINMLFALHNVKVDGIVNGLAKKNKEIQKIFKEKYRVSLHIDNESVLCVNLKTGEYDSYDINADAVNWAAEAMVAIKGIETIR